MSYQDGHRLLTVHIHCNFHSAVPLGDQAADTTPLYHIQSHYADISQTSPCPLLFIPSARLGSDMYQFGKL